MVFQDKAPLLRACAPDLNAENALRPSTYLLRAMGASLVSRLTYAAASRLDGIGQYAIGDMISSALKSSLGTVERFTSVTYPDTTLSPLLTLGASPSLAAFPSVIRPLAIVCARKHAIRRALRQERPYHLTGDAERGGAFRGGHAGFRAGIPPKCPQEFGHSRQVCQPFLPVFFLKWRAGNPAGTAESRHAPAETERAAPLQCRPTQQDPQNYDGA